MKLRLSAITLVLGSARASRSSPNVARTSTRILHVT